MKMTWNEIRIGCAAVGAWLGWFIGGFDNLLYALLTFVCLDYITGVLCACRERQLSSEIGFMGICRKVLLFVLVGVAHTLDETMLGSGSALRTATILFTSPMKDFPFWKMPHRWDFPYRIDCRKH